MKAQDSIDRPYTSRKLSYQLRKDLFFSEQVRGAETVWIAKDPIRLEYTELSSEEYFLLHLLDGQNSAIEIQRLFQRRYAPQQLSFTALQSFLTRMHERGLILANSPGQGDRLLQRKKKQFQQRLVGFLLNPLAIRWRGISPERLLNILTPCFGWCFHRNIVILSVLIWLAVLTLVLTRFQELQLRLTEAQQFVQLANWHWFLAAISFSKVLHEFGHAIACRRLGGKVHEIGAMLLVLTPALYCNTSDSWLFKNRWHRAAVGAAGIYVELWLAALSALVWWNSSPGFAHNFALSLILVCSVSTLVFNANPLMRFDGYYVLSDVLGISNLASRSSEYWRRHIHRWCLGIKAPASAGERRSPRWILAIYGLLAPLYRWFVSFSVYSFLVGVLRPEGFSFVGHVLGLLGLASLVLMPAWQFIKYVNIPGRSLEMKRANILSTACLGSILTVVFFFVPIPQRIHCCFVVQPQVRSSVYAEIPGQVVARFVSPGDSVKVGDPLMIVENLDIDVESLRLEAEVERLRTHYSMIERAVFSDRGALSSSQHAREGLEAAMDNYDLFLEERGSRRLVVASADGQVVPASRPREPRPEGRLADWNGTCFEERNERCPVTVGQEICAIGSAGRLEASIYVNQSEIEFVQLGQRVTIQFDALPERVLSADLTQISDEPASSIPPSLADTSGGPIAAEATASGLIRPLETHFMASVPLEADLSGLRPGQKGHAKIDVGTQTLAQRSWRWLNQTFQLKL